MPRPGQTAKAVIRGLSLALDDDEPGGVGSSKLGEASAREAAGHGRALVGHGKPHRTGAGFVQAERRIRQAVAIGRYNITLLKDLSGDMASAGHRRRQDEPGDHVAISPVAILGAERQRAIEPGAGLLDGGLESLVTAIKRPSRGDALRSAIETDNVGAA